MRAGGPLARALTRLVPLGALAGLSALACEPVHEPWERAPLPEGGVEVKALPSGPVLNLERVRFHSQEVGEPRFFLALVPSGERRARDVFVLNHGWADRPESLLRHLEVDRVYSEMLAAGEVRPAIVVIPDIRFASWYRRDAERFPFNQTLELVANEAASLVSRRYEVPFEPQRWGIGGFSFGGYVALDVARRYPGRFGSASVVSAFRDPDWTFWPASPPPPGRLDSRGRGKQTVVVPGLVPRLLLACGTGDRFYDQMLGLHRQLEAQGIAHEWTSAAGGHTWEYWASLLRPMIRFHLGQSAAAPPPPRAPSPEPGPRDEERRPPAY